MTSGTSVPDARLAAFVADLAKAATSAFVEVPLELLRAPGFRAALQNAQWYVTTLDRAPVFDKITLMHALYQSGEYPAGFGFNWDALLDVLRDLEWLESAQGIALVWRHPDVLAERSPDVAATFREVVEDACAHRAEHGYPPLRVLIPAEPAGRRGAHARLG
jgi:Barstar (barnase inhibitor)